MRHFANRMARPIRFVNVQPFWISLRRIQHTGSDQTKSRLIKRPTVRWIARRRTTALLLMITDKPPGEVISTSTSADFSLSEATSAASRVTNCATILHTSAVVINFGASIVLPFIQASYEKERELVAKVVKTFVLVLWLQRNDTTSRRSAGSSSSHRPSKRCSFRTGKCGQYCGPAADHPFAVCR